MTDRFDVTVVGAGFAGLACAQILRARGLEVAVLERKPAPGTAVHTTGILVKEAAEIWQVPPALTRRIHRVRLYPPNLKALDLASPGYYFLATDTPALLRWFAEQTEQAGARLHLDAGFAGAARHGDCFEIETTQKSCTVSARYIIGADGARSAVARTFGLGQNRHYLVGVEAEYEGVRGVDEDFLHTFLDSRLAPGYIAWLVPGVNGLTQVGLACRRPAKPSLDAFVATASRLFDFSRARVVARRSGPIPVGGAVRPISTAGVLLVGDAAGLVSPLTAGGIYTALAFGRQAGEAVAAHLTAGGPDPGPVLAAAYPRFRVKSLLRRAADFGIPNPLLNLAFALPPARALAQLVYFHSKGLGSGQAWRDLLRSRA